MLVVVVVVVVGVNESVPSPAPDDAYATEIAPISDNEMDVIEQIAGNSKCGVVGTRSTQPP